MYSFVAIALSDGEVLYSSVLGSVTSIRKH
jgi:hypothetical protein